MLSYFPRAEHTGRRHLQQLVRIRVQTIATTISSTLRSTIVSTRSNLVSGKYSYQYSHGNGLNCFKNFTDPCQGGPGWTNAHLFAINDTHTFSPTLLLNVTLGFTRGVWHIDAYNPQGVDDPLGTLGFPVVSAEQRISGCSRDLSQHCINHGRLHEYRHRPVRQLPAGAGHGTTGGHARQGSRRARVEIRLRRAHAPDQLHPDQRTGRHLQLRRERFEWLSRRESSTCGGDSMASFLMGQMTQRRQWQLVLRNPVSARHHELPVRRLRPGQLEGRLPS